MIIFFTKSDVERAVQRALETAALYYESSDQKGSANFMAHEVLKQLGLEAEEVTLLDLSKPSHFPVE